MIIVEDANQTYWKDLKLYKYLQQIVILVHGYYNNNYVVRKDIVNNQKI